MLDKILEYDRRPPFGAPSTAPFWDDPHVSAQMLQNHIDPAAEGATRNHAFVQRSAAWLAPLLGGAGAQVLDLGCGPGIYAERFAKAGLRVTGIDLSPRSIAYARRSAEEKGLTIDYVAGSYLEMDYETAFDAAVLIYCDYGALPAPARKQLLRAAARALRPGGRFVLDVFTPAQYTGREETKTWYTEKTGFWRAAPHLCLESFYRYEAESAFLTQYLIADAAGVECYHLWDHVFTQATLAQEFEEAGFGAVTWYGDIAGAAPEAASPTLCAVCQKQP